MSGDTEAPCPCPSAARPGRQRSTAATASLERPTLPSLFDRRPPGTDLPGAPALHVAVDRIDLIHLEPERAPGGHTLLRPPGAHHLHEGFLGVDRAVRLDRHHEMRCDGGPEDV